MFTKEQLLLSPGFQELFQIVERHLESLQNGTPDFETVLQQEREKLEQSCQGWRASLASPNIGASTRRVIEVDLESALNRIDEINAALARRAAQQEQHDVMLEPDTVADHIMNLKELLDGDNAPMTNVILSQHIDGIYCDRQGNVSIRSTILGAFASPDDISSGCLANQDAAPEEGKENRSVATGRRRTRRNLGFSEDEHQSAIANDFAVDTKRFADVPDHWFSMDTFQIPQRQSWVEKHAVDVANYRLEQRVTIEKTAQHFGKSVKTINDALKIAKEQHGVDATGKKVSMPTRNNWARDNAVRVAEYFRQPESRMKDAEKHFGKSQPTLSKARKEGEQILQERSDTDGG